MKSIISNRIYFLLVFVLGCSQNDTYIEKEKNFTGREVTYALESGSEYNISGRATLKERANLSTEIVITLNESFDENALFPVHLHLGDVATDQADIAASLQPVNARTGVSETVLTILADESPVTFDDITQMDACIKIHLSATGIERDIILAAGNIGAAVSRNPSNGRSGIGLCKSE